jgi:hypothetical protein
VSALPISSGKARRSAPASAHFSSCPTGRFDHISFGTSVSAHLLPLTHRLCGSSCLGGRGDGHGIPPSGQAPPGLLDAIEQIAHQQEGFGLVV